ncbi:MAG: DoxX family protein [Deltaproteobacteria bacterium]|nr:DoxX family protein [Candidatus Deferrimicrobiaceae bacterium]
MEARRQDLSTSIGLLILRLGIGGYLVTHGWGKLQMVLAGEFAKFGDPIGLGSGMSLVLVMTAEFLCALAVAFGAATRLAAAPVVISMGVAAFVAHAANPWTMEKAYVLFMSGAAKSWASKEPALLYLIPFLALVFTGAGRFSIDGMIRRHRGGK